MDQMHAYRDAIVDAQGRKSVVSRAWCRLRRWAAWRQAHVSDGRLRPARRQHRRRAPPAARAMRQWLRATLSPAVGSWLGLTPDLEDQAGRCRRGGGPRRRIGQRPCRTARRQSEAASPMCAGGGKVRVRMPSSPKKAPSCGAGVGKAVGEQGDGVIAGCQGKSLALIPFGLGERHPASGPLDPRARTVPSARASWGGSWPALM